MFWTLLYLAVFAQALIVSLILTPLARAWGRRWGMLDAPGERKIHTSVMPRSGGLAIYGSFVGVLVVDAALFWLLFQGDAGGARLAPYRANLPTGDVMGRFAAILAGLTIVFVVGAVDDRRDLGPRVKLAAQILSVVPLLIAGVRIDFFLHSWLPWPIAWLGGAALTIGWVVLLTNSFNFLDNMDGLSAGIGFVAGLVLAGFSIVNDHIFMAATYLVLAGALLGFLRFNWSPASLFMGDSGSLTIGFSLAALTINTRFYEAGAVTGLPVFIPVIVMSVPIFDTASVMLIRWRRGRPLMVGDKNHLSHRLVDLGFTKPQAVTFVCLLTLVTALMALPLRYLPLRPALLHVVGIGMLYVLFFILERIARRGRPVS